MTKRMMYAFDHIPTTLNSSGGNVGTYSDFPFTYAAGGGLSATTGGTLSDSDGVWLASSSYYYNTVSSMGQWSHPINAVLDVSKPRSWIGFRFKPGFSTLIGNPFGCTVNSTNLALLTTTDFSWVSTHNYYIEIMIDRVNQTRTVWVDGVLTVNAQPVSLSGQLSTDKLIFGFGAGVTGNTGCTYQYKDMYFLDDPNDGSVSRLGAIIAKPITIASATGTGWTPSTGTIASALNTAINTSTPSTPNVASATDGTPLAAAFGTTADASAAVAGVLLVGSGQRSPGTGTLLRTTLSDQATPPNSTSLTPTQFSSAGFQYGRSLGFLPSAPDGSQWSAAKITALNVSVAATAT